MLEAGYRLILVTGTSGVFVVAGATVVPGATVVLEASVVPGALVVAGGEDDASGTAVMALGHMGHTGQLVDGICQ